MEYNFSTAFPLYPSTGILNMTQANSLSNIRIKYLLVRSREPLNRLFELELTVIC